MTPKIKPTALKKTVYKVKGEGMGMFETDGTLSPYNDEPGIRTSNTPRDSNRKPRGNSDVNKHFVQGFNPLSFSLQQDGKTKVLRFSPAGATDNIVYLPYEENNITSTVVRTKDPSVRYFITDEMSGCNFFIDKLPGGDLVCHHANAKQYSPTEGELKADAGFFHPLAPKEMDKQHNIALTLADYDSAEPVAELRVKDYFANAKAAVDEKVRKGYTNVKFNGGATIMGFRVDEKWQFWFQTYTQLSYIRTGKAARKGEVVNVGDKPHKIIEARCFWPVYRARATRLLGLREKKNLI